MPGSEGPHVSSWPEGTTAGEEGAGVPGSAAWRAGPGVPSRGDRGRCRWHPPSSAGCPGRRFRCTSCQDSEPLSTLISDAGDLDTPVGLRVVPPLPFDPGRPSLPPDVTHTVPPAPAEDFANLPVDLEVSPSLHPIILMEELHDRPPVPLLVLKQFSGLMGGVRIGIARIIASVVLLGCGHGAETRGAEAFPTKAVRKAVGQRPEFFTPRLPPAARSRAPSR